MLLTVVNPDTTAAMTDVIDRAARAVAAPGTVIRAVTPDHGPVSIESHYDEALAAPGVLAEVAAGQRAGSDGYVIACFGDPRLCGTSRRGEYAPPPPKPYSGLLGGFSPREAAAAERS